MERITKVFWNEGLLYANSDAKMSGLSTYRKFRSFYGVSPNVMAIIWRSINKPSGAQPKHLLWCFFFLKRYNTENVNAAFVKVDEKTFRFWTWTFIELISNMNVVKWEKRMVNANYTNMFVTLDGTDFEIQEPTNFSTKWFSHKFNGPGIRYEVGISIGNADIVWASGGLPCGEWPDIEIAKDLYIHYATNEITLADTGYRHQNFKQATTRKERVLLARHENLNGRLKTFEILNTQYRHELKKHPLVFHACINILQICIEEGEKLFKI